ncbi:MAG: DnaJ domain-containing protein [Rhodospirillales bacterium]
MPYLLLGLALLIGGLLIAAWYSKADPKQVAKTVKIGGIAIVAVVVIYFAVAGRAQVLAALPLLAALGWRFWPMIARLAKRASRGGDQPKSTVRTRFFAMRMDHQSGHVDGEVLQGAFEGRLLSELSLAELQALRGDVSGDPQSLALIEAYLDRRDDSWRGEAGAAGGSRAYGQGADGGVMTHEEAYEILGLEPGATPDEIRQAHRRLMQKLHPDAGGSDWLAAKLNAAKDLLLAG